MSSFVFSIAQRTKRTISNTMKRIRGTSYASSMAWFRLNISPKRVEEHCMLFTNCYNRATGWSIRLAATRKPTADVVYIEKHCKNMPTSLSTAVSQLRSSIISRNIKRLGKNKWWPVKQPGSDLYQVRPTTEKSVLHKLTHVWKLPDWSTCN